MQEARCDIPALESTHVHTHAFTCQVHTQGTNVDTVPQTSFVHVPTALTTKSSSTQAADAVVLSGQSGRGVEVGKRDGNHKGAGRKDVLRWPGREKAA